MPANRLRHVVAMFLAVGCSAAMAGSGAAAERFGWRFEQGQKYRVVLDQEVVQKVSLTHPDLDKPIETQVATNVALLLFWEVTEVDRQGKGVLNCRFERVKISTSTGDDPPRFFDSKKPQAGKSRTTEAEDVAPPSPLVAAARALLGERVQLSISARGNIHMETPEDDSREAPATGKLASPIVRLLRSVEVELPKDALVPRESWKKPVSMETPLGRLRGEYVFRYVGPVDVAGLQLEQIGIDSSLAFENKPQKQPGDFGGLLVPAKETGEDAAADETPKIEEQSYQGSAFFNAVAGHLMRLESRRELKITARAGQAVSRQAATTDFKATITRVPPDEPEQR